MFIHERNRANWNDAISTGLHLYSRSGLLKVMMHMLLLDLFATVE